MTEAWSVDEAEMTMRMGRNGGGTGSMWVTVHGAGLGHDAMTDQARVGETGCEGTEWESGTSVRCMTGGQGGRGSGSLVVTAVERGGSMSEGY